MDMMEMMKLRELAMNFYIAAAAAADTIGDNEIADKCHQIFKNHGKPDAVLNMKNERDNLSAKGVDKDAISKIDTAITNFENHLKNLL